MIVSLLVLAVIAAGILFFDYQSWITFRRLSADLRSARSVTLEEYVPGVTIAQKKATPAELSRLRQATDLWMRPFAPSAALCFLPHHRIQIVRANGTETAADICFECENFMYYEEEGLLPLPPYLKESLALFFTSVGMAPKSLEEYAAIEQRRW